MLHRGEKCQNSLLVQLLRSSWEERAVGKWELWDFGDEVLQPWDGVALMRGMRCSGEGARWWLCSSCSTELGEGSNQGWKKAPQNAEFQEVREIHLLWHIIEGLSLEKFFFPASHTPSGTPSASVSLFQSKEYQRRLELFFSQTLDGRSPGTCLPNFPAKLHCFLPYFSYFKWMSSIS